MYILHSSCENMLAINVYPETVYEEVVKKGERKRDSGRVQGGNMREGGSV